MSRWSSSSAVWWMQPTAASHAASRNRRRAFLTDRPCSPEKSRNVVESDTVDEFWLATENVFMKPIYSLDMKPDMWIYFKLIDQKVLRQLISFLVCWSDLFFEKIYHCLMLVCTAHIWHPKLVAYHLCIKLFWLKVLTLSKMWQCLKAVWPEKNPKNIWLEKW